jgi:hypothetical protein
MQSSQVETDQKTGFIVINPASRHVTAQLGVNGWGILIPTVGKFVDIVGSRLNP